MALHDDLLEQAEHLAERERRKPRQASLRRAVSAAYYALFHLLANEGSRVLAPPQPSGLRFQVQRAFSHSDMKAVCRQFAFGNINNLSAETKSLIAPPLQPELAVVASAFIQLQEARHIADYDVSALHNKFDVLQKIALAKGAFEAWKQVRTSPNARVFLVGLLLERRWS